MPRLDQPDDCKESSEIGETSFELTSSRLLYKKCFILGFILLLHDFDFVSFQSCMLTLNKVHRRQKIIISFLLTFIIFFKDGPDDCQSL